MGTLVRKTVERGKKGGLGRQEEAALYRKEEEDKEEMETLRNRKE